MNGKGKKAENGSSGEGSSGIDTTKRNIVFFYYYYSAPFPKLDYTGIFYKLLKSTKGFSISISAVLGHGREIMYCTRELPRADESLFVLNKHVILPALLQYSLSPGEQLKSSIRPSGPLRTYPLLIPRHITIPN